MLPFTTQSDDRDAESIAEGVSEEITAGLSQFSYLSVIARQSTLRFKEASADVREVGSRPTANIEAYELYLKGRALLYQRGSSILPALEEFRKAVELDADRPRRDT